MEIYRSPFVTRSLDKTHMIILSKWLSNTTDMEPSDFKAEMLGLIELMQQYKAKLLLSDLREMLFLISPELQTWGAKNITPKFVEIGIQKQAIVIPADLFTQVSLEQFVEESIEKQPEQHQTRFFDTIESAMQWLKV